MINVRSILNCTQIWNLNPKSENLTKKGVDVVFTSAIEIRDRKIMSPQVHFDPGASVHRITYESREMNVLNFKTSSDGIHHMDTL